MVTYALYTIYALLTVGYVLLAYAAAMNLKKNGDDIPLPIWALLWACIMPFLALYVFLNVVVASVYFVDPPQSIQFTSRMKRYRRNDGRGALFNFRILRKWRKWNATWICGRVLNPLDLSGDHC